VENNKKTSSEFAAIAAKILNEQVVIWLYLIHYQDNERFLLKQLL
jgi:hypothetical protein